MFSPDDRTLRLENLSFSYDGADRDYVLEDINLTIPHNRVTAIVGASGSGKTTIVKLLLGFYNPNKGDVRIGDTSLKNLNPHVWRSKTGSVMQDGFIFSDTIANNIAPRRRGGGQGTPAACRDGGEYPGFHRLAPAGL